MLNPHLIIAFYMSVERTSRRLDHYLRREDSTLAKAFRGIHHSSSQEYRNSRTKRVVELTIAVPSALISTPVIGILAVAVRLSEGPPSFFADKRVGKDGLEFPLIKIRTMRNGSETEEARGAVDVVHTKPEDDPRNTKLGKRLRRHNVEELPQLWQVVTGRMALVGARATTQLVIDNVTSHSPEVLNKWQRSYYEGKPALFSLAAARNFNSKDNSKRIRYDLLYAQRASLGLDLYIFFKGVSNVLKTFVAKKKPAVNETSSTSEFDKIES